MSRHARDYAVSIDKQINRYGVDPSGAFTIDKSMVWPMLRIIPNDTRGCIMRRFGWDPLDAVTVNGRPLLNEKVRKISLKNALEVESDFNNGYYGSWKRQEKSTGGDSRRRIHRSYRP